MGSISATFVNLDGKEYAVLPRSDYERLLRVLPEETVNALEYMDKSLGKNLRAARQEAGLTQVQLAKKLKKSQALVASAEGGRIRVSERYVLAVLKACDLPDDWKALRKKRKPSL